MKGVKLLIIFLFKPVCIVLVEIFLRKSDTHRIFGIKKPGKACYPGFDTFINSILFNWDTEIHFFRWQALLIITHHEFNCTFNSSCRFG